MHQKIKNRTVWLFRQLQILYLKSFSFFKYKNPIFEFNEFTWDMVRSLPTAYYHYSNNLPFKVFHKPNLNTLYYFSKSDIQKNFFNTNNDKETYNFKRPNFTKNKWSPPPLKDHFSGYFNFSKPTLVIQNKYTLEFSGEGIFNFFDIQFLDEFFKLFKNKYQIVYIRPKSGTEGYYEDKNDILNFEDYNLIRDKHKEVLTIYDLMMAGDDFNETQFKIHATSEKHLSVSGGNACIAAYFGGELVIYDSPFGLGSGRGIWKTDSWLRLLSQSKIIGKNDYSSILDYTKKNWL
ncbi:hypothetical protein N8334_01500 [Flavobacteriaceae bacterium]|nr:hypothetical protein [Flavobacteriaceae bacterium]